MADERRIGAIDWRAATDEDDAVRKAPKHVLRLVRSMNLDDVTVLEGKIRHRGEGAVTHDEHVAARQLEETLDIGDIFAAAIALPRQTAAEAELAAEADGDDGADIGDLHDDLPHVFNVSGRQVKRFKRRESATRRELIRNEARSLSPRRRPGGGCAAG